MTSSGKRGEVRHHPAGHEGERDALGKPEHGRQLAPHDLLARGRRRRRRRQGRVLVPRSGEVVGGEGGVEVAADHEPEVPGTRHPLEPRRRSFGRGRRSPRLHRGPSRERRPRMPRPSPRSWRSPRQNGHPASRGSRRPDPPCDAGGRGGRSRRHIPCTWSNSRAARPRLRLGRGDRGRRGRASAGTSARLRRLRHCCSVSTTSPGVPAAPFFRSSSTSRPIASARRVTSASSLPQQSTSAAECTIDPGSRPIASHARLHAVALLLEAGDRRERQVVLGRVPRGEHRRALGATAADDDRRVRVLHRLRQRR